MGETPGDDPSEGIQSRFETSDSRFASRLSRVAFTLGLILSALLVVRTQVGGDQLNLLATGWRLSELGELRPYGNPLSGGGYEPGPATAVLVGAPLALWEHHRAPVVFIWLTHLVAWLLLARTLRGALSELELAAFALVYWLNPWRLGAASVLWNPYFLFLAGAVHFVTAYDQRDRPRFGSSFVHLCVLGIAAQLHPAAVMLLFLSLALAWRGTVRVHWPGALAGGAVALATLAPWMALVRERPELLPGGGGFPFRALALVQPWLKGVSYWFRYPSFALPQESSRLDFSAALGVAADRWLAPAFAVTILVAGVATVWIALVANRSFLREGRGTGLLPRGAATDGREFVRRYVVAGGAAMLVGIAASPTTPQSWQALPLFHVAVLPVALWLGGRLSAASPRPRIWARRGAAAAIALAVVLALGMAFGARNYRCGGRNGLVYPLLHDSPMLDALSIHETCRWPTHVPGGGWPADLPRSDQK